MQASTAGDQYSWTLTESDGVTPLPLTNVTIAQVAIAGPFQTETAALAASFTSGIVDTASLNTSPPTASWVTTIAGKNGAQITTYPVGGYYTHQIILTYSTGSVAKSALFVIQVSDSIA